MGARTVVVSHSGLLFFLRRAVCSVFFFFNDTATTEIYTLSLHDALPILLGARAAATRERGIHAGLHTVHPPAGEAPAAVTPRAKARHANTPTYTNNRYAAGVTRGRMNKIGRASCRERV